MIKTRKIWNEMQFNRMSVFHLEKSNSVQFEIISSDRQISLAELITKEDAIALVKRIASIYDLNTSDLLPWLPLESK